MCIRDRFKTALKMGVEPRAEVYSIDDVKKYLDIGVKHFSIETDITILYNYWKQNGDEIRKLLS